VGFLLKLTDFQLEQSHIKWLKRKMMESPSAMTEKQVSRCARNDNVSYLYKYVVMTQPKKA
jgi:hypothetical protein